MPCRLAASAGLDDHAPFSVGIPSWLRESSDPSPRRNYFFMHITPSAAASKPSSRRGSLEGVLSDHMTANGQALVRESGLAFGPRLVHKSPVPDLVLGPLLGKGGYGKVFRGLHKGQEVAVKVRETFFAVILHTEYLVHLRLWFRVESELTRYNSQLCKRVHLHWHNAVALSLSDSVVVSCLALRAACRR